MVENASNGALTASASSLDGMKTTFVCPEISIGSPVVTSTLRRGSTRVSRNVPRPLILTLSCASRVSLIKAKNSLRKSSENLFDLPDRSASLVERRGKVILLFLVADFLVS